MLKQLGSSTMLVMTVIVSAVLSVTPAAAQVSRYRMDFKPDDVIPGGGVGPTNYLMADFGWDDTHGQAGAPGVYFPDVPELDPEDPTNRAFVYLFGATGQTSSTFTSVNAIGGTAGSTFPVGGVDPTDPDNDGLGFAWAQHLEQATGGPIHVRFAVQTAAGSWYASNAIFDTATTGAGAQADFQRQVLEYNPAKTNWLDLTIGALPADGVTIGAQPAVDLTGNITGIGFIAAFTAAGNTTVHIDYVDVGIPPVDGDVTGDRMVTMADYNIIKANFGMQVPGRTDGDVTGDGIVDLLDFSQWKGNFPFPGGGGVGGGAVPEPTSAVLIALSLPLFGSMLRWRKKN